jgi:hypothetical protein
MVPCLLMDREKNSIIYRGPSIDASYQVSVHLAEGFQRRRIKCEVNCNIDIVNLAIKYICFYMTAKMIAIICL